MDNQIEWFEKLVAELCDSFQEFGQFSYKKIKDRIELLKRDEI